MPGETGASRFRRGAGLGFSVLLFGVFLASGASKLVASEFATQGFQSWGYPLWFMYLVGLGEVAGAAFVVMPGVRVFGASLRFWGAVLLGVLMAGAAGTHLMHEEIGMVLAPLILLAVSGYLAYTGRPRAARDA